MYLCRCVSRTCFEAQDMYSLRELYSLVHFIQAAVWVNGTYNFGPHLQSFFCGWEVILFSSTGKHEISQSIINNDSTSCCDSKVETSDNRDSVQNLYPCRGAHIYSFCFRSHWQFVTNWIWSQVNILSPQWKEWTVFNSLDYCMKILPSKHDISILAGNVPLPGAQAWRWGDCNLQHPWQDRRYHRPQHFSLAEAPWSPSLKARPSLYLDPPGLTWAERELRGQCPTQAVPGENLQHPWRDSGWVCTEPPKPEHSWQADLA